MNAKLTTLAVVVLVAVAAAPVGASGGPQHTGAVSQPDGNETTAATGERIDSSLTLVSRSYNQGSGTVTLTFDASEPTAVTLSDAGGFIGGGEINRRTFVADGRETVEFAVTETDRGYVGVSIATDEVLYGEVVKSPSLSPFRESSGTVGWMAGAGIVLVSFVGAALWKLHKEGGEPVEAGV